MYIQCTSLPNKCFRMYVKRLKTNNYIFVGCGVSIDTKISETTSSAHRRHEEEAILNFCTVSKYHEYCFTEYHLQYDRKGVKKGYTRGWICTCYETVMKNSKEPNLGDEGQSALSEQKGTDTSSPIRGTIKYDFTIQVILS